MEDDSRRTDQRSKVLLSVCAWLASQTSNARGTPAARVAPMKSVDANKSEPRLEDMAQSQGILIAVQEIAIQVECAGCSAGTGDNKTLARRSSPVASIFVPLCKHSRSDDGEVEPSLGLAPSVI
ncbi:hypothetical protein AVME950_20835 [Acidovorax sp. SUPP950]|uniref:hypothetical protein n=1 Tax=Acidovorax sp. SUPP950 TaxID=511901 RepID=UPI0023D6668C|nr:hypothetical protein [Acidovorax sp. SUPP950]GKS77385.1 hypothetical protein AVME950_20835 [Acidovorax sp. SUPP950]